MDIALRALRLLGLLPLIALAACASQQQAARDSRQHAETDSKGARDSQRMPIQTPSPTQTPEEQAAARAQSDSIRTRLFATRQTSNAKAWTRLVAYYDGVDSYVRSSFVDPIQTVVPRSNQDVAFASCHALWNDERELRDCLIQNFRWDVTEAATWARDSTVRALNVQILVAGLQSIVPTAEASFAQPVGNITTPALLAAIIRRLGEQYRIPYPQTIDALQRFIASVASYGDPDRANRIEWLAGLKLGTAASHGRELRSLPEIMSELSDAYNRIVAAGDHDRASELLQTLFGVRDQSLAIGAVMLKEMRQSIDDAVSGVRLY